MDALGQNLKFAARQLWRNPGFSATVILTLALSIGANTAIFSIVNALILKSLPYSHPERMGTIYTWVTGLVASDERHHLNGEQWELLRDEVPSLMSAVSGIRASGVNLQAGSQSGSKVQYIHAGRVSARYFDVLAIHPILGRNFSDAEDRPHGPKTAILSYNVWHNIFGSDPHILAQSILLKGEPYTVIGVLPDGATTPLNAGVYTALQPSPDGEGGERTLRPSPGCVMARPGRRPMPRSTAPGCTAPIGTNWRTTPARRSPTIRCRCKRVRRLCCVRKFGL